MKTATSVLAMFFGAVLLAAAPPSRGPANDDCLTCHGDASARNARGKTIYVARAKFAASVHGSASCVDCHADLAKTTDFPHKEKLAPVACASCHDSVGASHPFHPRIERALKGDGTPETDCASCHGSHDITAVKAPSFRFATGRQVQSCTACHGDVGALFLSSEHGRALARNVPGAPDCLFCHSKPLTSGNRIDRIVLKRSQERLCISCHAKPKSAASNDPAKASFVASYETSVHGAALSRGVSWAPNCVDCHGAHENRHSFDPASRVNKMHVQEVCGRCHGSEMKQFVGSVHGMALARGNKDAPACTDCHGEHSVLAAKDPRSPVAAGNVSAQVCSPCHASLKLAEKWSLPMDRAKTFAASYHGLAARGGSGTVANCASCHGAHDILPSSDPASRISKGNLATTCGASGCHPGANAKFGSTPIHLAASTKEEPLIFWIGTIYIVLIVLTIGGMLLHNTLDFAKKARHVQAVRRGELAEEPAGRGLYLRMTLNERLQHGSLMVSFTLLVITGFMLRYPDAWWVVGIRRLSTRAFDLRSLIHRIAGIWMIAASLFHVLYVVFTARGRKLVSDLWFRMKDLKDALGLLRFNAGLSHDKPQLDRFSYIEKAEYWALVWGTIVMAATGIAMWFDNTFIGLFSKLGYDIARTIHFYEAWLATLAIVVWHLYFVIFNPEAFPMNMAWWTGKLSEREMREEHPLELDRLHSGSPAPGGSPAGAPPA
jgi:cytochrome b subunit of formate dehydrogenase